MAGEPKEGGGCVVARGGGEGAGRTLSLLRLFFFCFVLEGGEVG